MIFSGRETDAEHTMECKMPILYIQVRTNPFSIHQGVNYISTQQHATCMYTYIHHRSPCLVQLDAKSWIQFGKIRDIHVTSIHFHGINAPFRKRLCILLSSRLG